MKALISLLTVALGVISGSALAQSSQGTNDPAMKSEGSSGSHTKQERSDARSQRLSESARENKAGTLDPGGTQGTAASGGPPESGKAYTSEERSKARSERLEETGKENKAGTLPSGGDRGSMPTK
jgi:hypothetical protein